MFNGAIVGSESEVRVGGAVQINSTLPAGSVVPIGWVAVGNPAQILPPSAHEEISPIQRELDFTRTVFGMDREATQAEVSERYGRALGRHRDDEPVEPLRDLSTVEDDGNPSGK